MCSKVLGLERVCCSRLAKNSSFIGTKISSSTPKSRPVTNNAVYIQPVLQTKTGLVIPRNIMPASLTTSVASAADSSTGTDDKRRLAIRRLVEVGAARGLGVAQSVRFQPTPNMVYANSNGRKRKS